MLRIRGLYAQGDLLARSDAVVQAQDGEGGVLQRSDAVIIRLVGEVEGQDAHADKVGAVDTLKTLGDDGFDAQQIRALGRPVAEEPMP